MKYSLRILKKQKYFQETKMSYKCIERHMFLGTQLQPMGGFAYH